MSTELVEYKFSAASDYVLVRKDVIYILYMITSLSQNENGVDIIVERRKEIGRKTVFNIEHLFNSNSSNYALYVFGEVKKFLEAHKLFEAFIAHYKWAEELDKCFTTDITKIYFNSEKGWHLQTEDGRLYTGNSEKEVMEKIGRGVYKTSNQHSQEAFKIGLRKFR